MGVIARQGGVKIWAIRYLHRAGHSLFRTVGRALQRHDLCPAECHWSAHNPVKRTRPEIGHAIWKTYSIAHMMYHGF